MRTFGQEINETGPGNQIQKILYESAFYKEISANNYRNINSAQDSLL